MTGDNKYECTRCGACCVAPEIKIHLIPEVSWKFEVFKSQGEVCRYLRYNSETRIATCSVHEVERPVECEVFRCDMEFDDKRLFPVLKAVAEKMPEIMRDRKCVNVEDLIRFVSSQKL